MSYSRGRGRGVTIRKSSSPNSVSLNSSNSSSFNHYGAKVQNSYNKKSSVSVQQNVSKVQATSSSNSIILKQSSYSLDMDPNTEMWLQELRKYWTKFKKGPLMKDMLFKFFVNCGNPYQQAITLCYNCLDFRDAKPKSMAFLIMEEFHEWSLTNRENIVNFLSLELKFFAFNIVKRQQNVGLTKLVIQIYEIENDSKHFLDDIMLMISEKKYKEASQCSLLLGLQNEFGVEDFLVPLILQDKLVVVDEFLIKSPKHQIELVSYLDAVLGNSCNIRQALEPVIVKLQIPEVKMVKLHYKPWRKLIARLLKMFKLPMECAPHLIQKRNKGALQFLLHKRFVEGGFSDESWREMVYEAVKDDEALQQELVIQVAIFGDPAEALQWAHTFNVDRSYWPQAVRLYEDDPNAERHVTHQVLSKCEECWDNIPQNKAPLEYHTLKLPMSCVYLVDNPTSFEKFLDYGLKDVNLVGIDCEWKPSFGVHLNELSVMQVATREAVFILDIIKLGSRLSHLWQEFGEIVFNNCDILKLGFGFSADFAIIRHSLPHLTAIQNRIGFLDLLSLWKHVEKTVEIKFPFYVEGGGPSLATLVHMCLGHSLDKSDQFSNWENRPLRENQLKYAALDAYCLIEVYDVIKKCCESVGYPFHELCFQIMSSPKEAKKKPKKTLNKKLNEKQIIEQPPSPHTEQISPQSVKIVCDTMLQGLGKSLRRCGVDTIILENQDDHMICVKIAQNEKRYIITKGTTFNSLVGCVPSGHCLRINSDDIDEQLKEILAYYKIEVTKDDVFSRCQMCNSNSFVKLSKSTMNALAESFHNPCVPSRTYYVDEHLEDEASGFSSDDDFYDEGTRPPLSYTRKWDLCSDENVDVGLCLTRLGVKIQMNTVPEPIMQKTDLFYVCENCGKVYWDGSHFEKVISKSLHGIVKK